MAKAKKEILKAFETMKKAKKSSMPSISSVNPRIASSASKKAAAKKAAASSMASSYGKGKVRKPITGEMGKAVPRVASRPASRGSVTVSGRIQIQKKKK